MGDEESSSQSYDAAMPQDAARQSEAAPSAAELRRAQDKIAALEDKIADMKAQLEAAQRRELWLQGQIDQIQQRLLPPPRQRIIERIDEAIARLRRPGAAISKAEKRAKAKKAREQEKSRLDIA